jgi:hypothetical protein
VFDEMAQLVDFRRYRFTWVLLVTQLVIETFIILLDVELLPELRGFLICHLIRRRVPRRIR